LFIYTQTYWKKSNNFVLGYGWEKRTIKEKKGKKKQEKRCDEKNCTKNMMVREKKIVKIKCSFN